MGDNKLYWMPWLFGRRYLKTSRRTAWSFLLDAFAKRVDRPRISQDLHSPEAEFATAAFKLLRTTVAHGMLEHACNSVMVTGATSNVGKSTVSINLALVFARQTGRRVILVELDLRKPSIADTFGLEVTFGIEQAAYVGFDIERSLIKIPELGIEVLPCGSAQYDSSEILTSDGLTEVLDTLATTYRDAIVIYDAPPALGCDDVLAMSASMKTALMVVEEGRTTRKELLSARRAIDTIPLLSVVLNKSNSSEFKNYFYPSTASCRSRALEHVAYYRNDAVAVRRSRRRINRLRLSVPDLPTGAQVSSEMRNQPRPHRASNGQKLHPSLLCLQRSRVAPGETEQSTQNPVTITKPNNLSVFRQQR